MWSRIFVLVSLQVHTPARKWLSLCAHLAVVCLQLSLVATPSCGLPPNFIFSSSPHPPAKDSKCNPSCDGHMRIVKTTSVSRGGGCTASLMCTDPVLQSFVALPFRSFFSWPGFHTSMWDLCSPPRINLNCPLQWKSSVYTGPPGKSPCGYFFTEMNFPDYFLELVFFSVVLTNK